MNLELRIAGITLVAVLGLGGCLADDDDGIGGPGPDVQPTAGTVGGYDYDANIDRFLDTYVREDQLFENADLAYDVRDGVVSVRGRLRNETERESLQRRIMAVPGVREIDMNAVEIGE